MNVHVDEWLRLLPILLSLHPHLVLVMHTTFFKVNLLNSLLDKPGLFQWSEKLPLPIQD